MLANNSYSYLFNYNSGRFNNLGFKRSTLAYSPSNSSDSVMLPSLSQLPVPNLNQNTLAPIQPSSRKNIQLRYKCSACTKSFNRKNSLVRHERVHTGMKPYACKACNKRFTRKDILEGHKLSIKCQRRTQFYLENSLGGGNIVEESFEVENMTKSDEYKEDDSRRNSIASLLTTNNNYNNTHSMESYLSSSVGINDQWSPLQLPSLSSNQLFTSSPISYSPPLN